MLGVNASHLFNSWGNKPVVAGTAEEIAQALPASAGRASRPAMAPRGRGSTTGAYLELADLEAAEHDEGLSGLWMRRLLVRRSIADDECIYFTTWCPAGTTIDTLIKAEGHRWAIEDAFETAKNELGLDHNDTRSWHGWHRHVSLVMLAFACWRSSAAGRTRPHPQDPDPAPLQAPDLIRWSVQELRRIAVRLARRRIQPACAIAWSVWRRAH